MKTSLTCIPCFVQQSLRLIESQIEDLNTRESVLREILHYLANEDFQKTAPEIVFQIQEILSSKTGINDPYINERNKQNQIAIEISAGIRKNIHRSSDHFLEAVKYSIVANCIDLGAYGNIDRQEIEKSFAEASDYDLDQIIVDQLKSEIEKARSILYLGDNAGEIVFDRLFIELLDKEKICYAVRGKPALNDAILKDARQVGLDQYVRVIDNGSALPGTVLEKCSEEFRRMFNQADLVISKGQGNFETLNQVKKNIFFLLKIKCPAIAKLTGKTLNSNVIIRNYGH